MHNEAGDKRGRRRSVPLLWGGGAVAAAVLVLGVNGTLSSWTDAILNNTNNTVATAQSVSLLETGTESSGGVTTCDTADQVNIPEGATSYDCTTINKYGGIADPNPANATDGSGKRLSPDNTTANPNTQVVTITMKNNGTASGDLTLTPQACSNSAYPGSPAGLVDTTTYNICEQMQIAVACTGDGTSGLSAAYAYVPGTTPGTLSQFNTDGTQNVGTLAAGNETTCAFTLTLPMTTPVGFASQVATQALQWEITPTA